MTPPLRLAWRALARRPLMGGAACAVALASVTLPRTDSADGALLVLRGAAVLLAGGLAWALDDAAAPVLAASPTPLRRRVALPVALAALTLAPVWAALLAAAALVTDGVPVVGLTVELLALAAAGLAVAAGLRTWRGTCEPGVLACPVVFGVVVVVSRLPQEWAMLLPSAQAPGWDAAVARWTALLLAAVVVVLLATRDPARRSPRPAPSRPAVAPTGVRRPGAAPQ